MRKTSTTEPGVLAMFLIFLFMFIGDASASEPEYLNRSIYMPIEFRLCEHLTNAVFYQDDVPVSTMPAGRVFQFTYYPKLERLLPELVRVRVEGEYEDESEPFVARLAVTPMGVHSAHRTRAADIERQVHKQKHKVDVRLEPKVIGLRCPRFCKRAQNK